MTPAEARAWLEDETQWQSAPSLAAVEVDRLLERARVADTAGVAPGGEGYAETFSGATLHQAAAQGWRMKAGKVAAAYDAGAGDGVYAKRSQIAAFCAEYAAAHELRALALDPETGVGSVAVTMFGYAGAW